MIFHFYNRLKRKKLA